jgi:hypothetical protein
MPHFEISPARGELTSLPDGALEKALMPQVRHRYQTCFAHRRFRLKAAMAAERLSMRVGGQLVVAYAQRDW